MGIHKGNPSTATKYGGYIINTNIAEGKKGHEIPFLFSPDSLSDNVSASYSQNSLPGSSAPQITYTNTGARQVSLSLHVSMDYLPAGSLYNNIEEYLNAFRALVYPEYSNSGIITSPNCILSLSNIYLTGVCTSCGIEYNTNKFGQLGELSANVSLSFTEVLSSKTSSSTVAGRVTVLGNYASIPKNLTTYINNDTYSSSNDVDASNLKSTIKFDTSSIYDNKLTMNGNSTYIYSIPTLKNFKDPGATCSRKEWNYIILVGSFRIAKDLWERGGYTIKDFKEAMQGTNLADVCPLSRIRSSSTQQVAIKIYSSSTASTVLTGLSAIVPSLNSLTSYFPIERGNYICLYGAFYIPMLNNETIEYTEAKLRCIQVDASS